MYFTKTFALLAAALAAAATPVRRQEVGAHCVWTLAPTGTPQEDLHIEVNYTLGRSVAVEFPNTLIGASAPYTIVLNADGTYTATSDIFVEGHDNSEVVAVSEGFAGTTLQGFSTNWNALSVECE